MAYCRDTSLRLSRSVHDSIRAYHLLCSRDGGTFTITIRSSSISFEAADPSSDAYSLATKFFVRLMDGNTSLVDAIVMGLQILCLLAFVVLLFLKLDRVLGMIG